MLGLVQERHQVTGEHLVQRVHLVHYHGVLGPHAKDRGIVVTQAERPGDALAEKEAGKKRVPVMHDPRAG